MTFSFFRNKDGIIVMYDITNEESFFSILDWMDEIDKYYPENGVVKLLIGAKCDMEAKREVDYEMARVLLSQGAEGRLNLNFQVRCIHMGWLF